MRVSRALSTGKIDSVTGETKGAGVWTGPWEDKTGLLEAADKFVRRHLGPSSDADVNKMLKAIGVESLDALIDKTIPSNIRMEKLPWVGPERSESELLSDFKRIMSRNQVFRSHIGAGYYNTKVPLVILRNIMENPAWYTPYTPYQAEISQGRLEMLLNFQTMVTDLTGMPVANASLLDEATAAAEAMAMCLHMNTDEKRKTFLVAAECHPQTLGVVQTRAHGLGIKIQLVHRHEYEKLAESPVAAEAFGVLLQYPNTYGLVENLKGFTDAMHSKGIKVVVGTDLLALTLLQPPGEWGADVAFGSAQRFGVPMGFGGPHAAFFACRDEHKRKMPGRIIGVSKDSRGKPCLRMAMQTREQHIRRDKATSNICTAQALLANMAAAYSIYHGPENLKKIAKRTHALSRIFAHGLRSLDVHMRHKTFFDTVVFNMKGQASVLASLLMSRRINVRVVDRDMVGVSFDETSTANDVQDLWLSVAEVLNKPPPLFDQVVKDMQDPAALQFPEGLARTSPFLQHPVFNMYHSETEMLRYLYSLQSKDLSLATAMIPLGSCTMKLNATAEMIPVTWPEVNGLHPFAPLGQTRGYRVLLNSLGRDLAKLTGFAGVSLQPNAGSQGEYAGLAVIQKYHQSRNQGHRNVCLIPTSAHGTNPASAAMMSMKIVVVKCDDKGNVEIDDLKAKVEQHKDNLSCLMITYPSTHGVFEEGIVEICKIVHDAGGQVYMDGANMNAQVGLTSPGTIGADVCHLNLHKTFCIPHGGGGPGMGPIGVAAHLVPFLPGHPWSKSTQATNVGAVAAAPFSSASILPISWMYIKLMGSAGLARATKVAILNANYMMSRLKSHYPVLYTGKSGTCAHEFIIDIRPLKAKTGITEEDVAKRLMDFNFHAPTMSFPVPGTLMIEPTESESLYELDRFCDAMIAIRQEIDDVEKGKLDKLNNPLKNAPHTADVVLSDKWDRPYPREKAAYPLPYLRGNKFWPTVGRVDNVYGDRNVICTCPPISAYA